MCLRLGQFKYLRSRCVRALSEPDAVCDASRNLGRSSFFYLLTLDLSSTYSHQYSPSSAHALAISICSSVEHTSTLLPPSPFLPISTTPSPALLTASFAASSSTNPRQAAARTTAARSDALRSPTPPEKTSACGAPPSLRWGFLFYFISLHLYSATTTHGVRRG
jgi:hypothetical protein